MSARDFLFLEVDWANLKMTRLHLLPSPLNKLEIFVSVMHLLSSGFGGGKVSLNDVAAIK